MKTIREWLNEFPVEIRDRAIRNAEASSWNAMDNQHQNITYALAGAFNWYESPEKDDYWNAWYEWLEDPSQTKPTIQPADGSAVVGNHSFEANEKIEPEDKTVRECLNELPDEIRDRAIRNAESHVPCTMDDLSHSEGTSLFCSFIWSRSAEGYSFWNAWREWLQDPSQPKPTIQPADGSVVSVDNEASTQARQFIDDALKQRDESYGVEGNGILDVIKEGGEDHSGDVNEKIERMRFEAASMYMAALAAQPGSPAHKAELSVSAADALIAELQKPKP